MSNNQQAAFNLPQINNKNSILQANNRIDDKDSDMLSELNDLDSSQRYQPYFNSHESRYNNQQFQQMPEELQNVQLEDIVDKYKKEKSKLSSLSMTKYKFITDKKRNGKGDLHYFPDIQKRKEMPFISHNQAKQLNLQLLKQVQEQQNLQKGIEQEKKNKKIEDSDRPKIDYGQDYTQSVPAVSVNDLNSLFLSPKATFKTKKNNRGISDATSIISRQNKDQSINATFDMPSMITNRSLHQNDQSHLISSKKIESILAQHQDYYQKMQLLGFELVHNQNTKQQFKNNNDKLLRKKWDVFLKDQWYKQNKIDKLQKQIKSYPVRDEQHKLEMQQAQEEAMGQSKDKHDEKKNVRFQQQDNPKQEDQKDVQTRQAKTRKLSKQFSMPTFKDEKYKAGKFMIYFPQFDQYFWRPYSRESCKIAISNGVAYLYGGSGVRPLNEMNVLYKFDTNSFKWAEVKWKGDIPKSARYGHSMVGHKNQIVIFGGADEHGTLTNDTRLVNVDKGTIQVVRAQGDIIEPRRNNGYFIINRFLFIHGGNTQKGTNFNDLWEFDLISSRWNHVLQLFKNQGTFTEDSYFSQGISQHQIVPVFHPDRKNIQLYKPLEPLDRYGPQFQNEGIYIFGGIDNDQQIYGDLFIMKLEGPHKNAYVDKVETYGQPPCPRYNHTMNYCENIGILVIYGGITGSKESNQFLDDLYILKIQKLEWIKPQINGISPVPRSGHSSFCLGSRMYYFGGLNETGYVSCDTISSELSQKQVKFMMDNRSNLDRINEEEASTMITKSQNESIQKANSSIHNTHHHNISSSMNQVSTQSNNNLNDKHQNPQFYKVNDAVSVNSSQQSLRPMDKMERDLKYKLNFQNFKSHQPILGQSMSRSQQQQSQQQDSYRNMQMSSRILKTQNSQNSNIQDNNSLNSERSRGETQNTQNNNEEQEKDQVVQE